MAITLKAIQKFISKYPQVEFVKYDIYKWDCRLLNSVEFNGDWEGENLSLFTYDSVSKSVRLYKDVSLINYSERTEISCDDATKFTTIKALKTALEENLYFIEQCILLRKKMDDYRKKQKFEKDFE